jgi:hypothetical protein
VPYRKVAAEALAEWRGYDRRLADAEPGSEAWSELTAQAADAKARYEAAIAAARAEHLPVPPPFDVARRDGYGGAESAGGGGPSSD